MVHLARWTAHVKFAGFYFFTCDIRLSIGDCTELNYSWVQTAERNPVIHYSYVFFIGAGHRHKIPAVDFSLFLLSLALTVDNRHRDALRSTFQDCTLRRT